MESNSSQIEGERKAIERYRRAVNYLTAAQIYLKENPLLDEPLRPEHIKE
ncbi:MAG: xfp, partial [Deltaproteobacteria bacterium]|nr:xfp [Deltaproteobacteria bacterium]